MTMIHPERRGYSSTPDVVHAIGCERGVHYYAMQFIQGQSLDEVIEEVKRRLFTARKEVEGG